MVRISSYWSRVDPSSYMAGALLRRGDTEPAQGEGPMITAQNWSVYVFISQGTPRVAGICLQREHSSARTLTVGC